MTKRLDCALGIIRALYTPVNVKQQMELSLDAIVFGSPFDLKSAHLYISAAIRQLERRTIERDCVSTLAVTLKKGIKGLHERTSQHFG